MDNDLDAHVDPHEGGSGEPVRWEHAAVWAINFVEPLFTDGMREDNRANMQASCLERPMWAAAWFAGVLSDIVGSLPDRDPWKTLSRDADGMVADKEFGTWTSAIDIGTPIGLDDLSRALKYSAISTVMPSSSRDVFAAAGDGFDTCRECLVQRCGRNNGQAVFDIGSRSLAWACFRRRQYLGFEDNFAVQVMSSWGRLADEAVHGRDRPDESVQYVVSEKLDNTSYLPYWEIPDLNPDK